jgi:ribosomal protein S18 acetylase RimI-like enzyme
LIQIRPSKAEDRQALWRILEPVLRAGETYPQPRDISEADALAYWLQPAHEGFVAEDEETHEIVGTYYLKANTSGPGSHVANCGYMTLPTAQNRGIARAMCMHSLVRARARGFRAMQFNLVISSNERAVHLWQSCGFRILTRLPGAFLHPKLGYVDALILWQDL